MTIAGRRLPEGRYGSRGRPAGRRASWLAGVAALLVGGAIAVLAYANFGTTPIRTERTAFENLAGNAMRMSFTVARDDPGRAALCIVRVRGRDGNEGGRKEVLVPPGESQTAVTTVIRSTVEPVTADVFGCSYQVPEYMSSTTRPSG